jgi:hypothetical protein
LLSEIRGGKAPASSTVFNWVRSCKSGKEIAQKGVSTSLPTTYLPPATENQIRVDPGGETQNIWRGAACSRPWSRSTSHHPKWSEDGNVRAHCASQNLKQQQKQTRVDHCLNFHIHPSWLNLNTFSST